VLQYTAKGSCGAFQSLANAGWTAAAKTAAQINLYFDGLLVWSILGNGNHCAIQTVRLSANAAAS
jgi:hypothetical protein